MERVDVAVVGGGPAGSAAARAAADGGADAVVFEKGVPREDRDELGPDSTDAAGILDYWVDIMDLEEGFPEEVIHRTLDRAEFVGPTEELSIGSSGIDATYPHFGFTYDRAAFDDWLRDRAEDAGADYRVGTAVADVETSLADGHSHELSLRDGDRIEAEHLVLADGPQRTVTLGVLEQFFPDAADRLDSTKTNHIAYQEYRRFPEECFDPGAIRFWWGYIPGHTAYPWVFPNEDTIARVGLTMPIGLDLDAIEDRDAYRLLRPEDERVPAGRKYIERLFEVAYPEYDLEDFPIVEDRGKRDGTETYPISSTLPIDSPAEAGIAVTGGAMGATSAFHEGGGHVAIRTGKIAGELAARGEIDRYNRAWKEAIDAEILRNVALADLVRGFGPADWDRTFRVANRLQELGAKSGHSILQGAKAAGLDGVRLAAEYRWHKYRYRDGRYVQVRESEYDYSRV